MADRHAGQPVHVLHIGKTGGTALRHALRAVADRGDRPLYLHGHEVTLADVPPGQPVVFFLRDPSSRFVSGFYSRQREGRPRYEVSWSEAERRAFAVFHTPNHLASSLGADDRSLRERAEEAMRGIGHVKDSYWTWFANETYLRERLDDILFVGFQESLDRDFARLKALLGLDAAVVLPVDDVQAHRNPPHLDRSLSDAAAANLRHWYRSDYDFIRLCEGLPGARQPE